MRGDWLLVAGYGVGGSPAMEAPPPLVHGERGVEAPYTRLSSLNPQTLSSVVPLTFPSFLFLIFLVVWRRVEDWGRRQRGGEEQTVEGKNGSSKGGEEGSRGRQQAAEGGRMAPDLLGFLMVVWRPPTDSSTSIPIRSVEAAARLVASRRGFLDGRQRRTIGWQGDGGRTRMAAASTLAYSTSHPRTAVRPPPQRCTGWAQRSSQVGSSGILFSRNLPWKAVMERKGFVLLVVQRDVTSLSLGSPPCILGRPSKSGAPPNSTPSGYTRPSCSMPRHVSSFLLWFVSLSLLQPLYFRCNLFYLLLFQAYVYKLFDEMTE
jgi:hypothetical protein